MNVENNQKTDESVQVKSNDNKTQNHEKETFSKDYVHELREENKSWRLKSSDAEKKAKDAEEQFNTKFKELEKSYSEKEKAAQERIILAELKAVALSHGIVDLDGLKLIDKSTVKINDNGEIEGAEDLIKQFKENKPYLFKKSESSTYTGKESSSKKAEKKAANAFDMTEEEYKSSLRNKSYRK